MLEIKNLTYKYENHIALNNINLKIENLNSVIKAKDTIFENSKQNYESIIHEYKRELESSAENIKKTIA